MSTGDVIFGNLRIVMYNCSVAVLYRVRSLNCSDKADSISVWLHMQYILLLGEYDVQ